MIIPTIKKSKTEDSGLEEYILNKRKVVVRSTKDDIRRICYIPKDYRPTIRELFINQIWNSETKTGIKGLDEEMLMTMYYEE